MLVEKQPEKTFIGRVEKGFDYLGYHLRPGRIEVSTCTIRRFAKHAVRLYEREQGQSNCPAMLGEYVRRWRRWAAGGLGQSLLVQEAHSDQSQ